MCQHCALRVLLTAQTAWHDKVIRSFSLTLCMRVQNMMCELSHCDVDIRSCVKLFFFALGFASDYSLFPSKN